jgi:2-methylcitrate dehydratase PrpD
MNPTKKLAEHVVNTSYSDLPDDVIDVVKRQVIYDGCANILAGSHEPLGLLLARYLDKTTDSAQATVAGHDMSTQMLHAAFANGTFCHSMDYELMWYPPMHPTSPTLPTALALAEQTETSGKDIMTAIALGFEVMARINLAERAFETDDDQFEIAHNFHSPGRLGPFGAASVASHLLDLDVQQTRIAFGIAGSRSSGLGANTGSMTKATHPGNAARLGLEAALLAELGWTASDSIFDAREGYNQVVQGNRMETDVLVENFGDPYRLVDPGLSLKKHPAQYPTHWSIDAAINVRSSNDIDPETIETVTVEVGADCESALQDTLDR